MKDFIFIPFIKLMTLGYEKIFQEKVSDEVNEFLKNLSYVGFGTIIATIFSFSFNILTGRILGPHGLGEFMLIQSVAMFLYLPMTLGFCTAMVKYNAESKDFDRQQSIISTTYFLVLIFTTISIFIYYLFSSQISKIFSISKESFYFSIVFAVLFVFYTLTTSTLRGLADMKRYAIFQPIYSIIALLAFLVFVFINFISFKSGLYSMYIAYGITGGIIIFSLRKYLKFNFDKMWTSQMMRYGNYALIGGISFALYTNIDKILINKYLSVEDVGIYRAYYYASVAIVGLFYGSFTAVFFPVASKCVDKNVLFKKINKFTPYLVGFGLPSIIISEFTILKFYGDKYPIDFTLLLFFSVSSFLVYYYSLYDWTFCSEGMKGIKLVNVSNIIITIINISLNIFLIPRVGLLGAIISNIFAFFIGICFLLLFKRQI
jgi:O-antigen/teichoic acid export membrane protein